MDNRIVMISIAAVIGIIVLGSVLMPILDDATATNETFTNEGYYPLTKLSGSSEATLVWDTSTPSIVKVNGESINLPTTGRLTLLGSDSICIRYNAGSNAQIQVFGSNSGSQDYKALNQNTGGTLTATIASGSVSVVVNTDAAKTFDLGNDAYLIAPEGVNADYVAVMKLTTEKAHLLGDSEIVICGISVSNNQSQSIGVFGKGNMTDGMTFSTFFVGSNYTGDVTFTNLETYSEVVDGYVDLYTLEKYTVTINYNESSTSDATYSYFIVPAEVTAEKAVHFTAGQNAIFAAMPVMIILAVLLGVVALVIRSRMD